MRTGWLGCAAVVCVAGPAWSQTADLEATRAEGERLYDAHQYEEALRVFAPLAERAPSGRSLAQLAMTEAALHRWVDAEGHLQRALDRIEPWVESHRTEPSGGLVAWLADVRRHIGQVHFTCNISGADLYLRGERVAALPYLTPIRLNEGDAPYEVRMPGYATHRGVVTVRGGAVHDEVVNLVALPGVVGTVRVAPPWMRPTAWATAASGALLLAGGAAALAVGTDAASRWNDDGQCLAPGQTRASRCADDRDLAATMRPLAWVGLLGGAALAVTSAVLFVSASRAGGREQRAWRCGTDGRTVDCAVTF